MGGVDLTGIYRRCSCKWCSHEVVCCVYRVESQCSTDAVGNSSDAARNQTRYGHGKLGDIID